MRMRGLAAVFVVALLAFAVTGPPGVSAAEEKLPSKSDASCVKCHRLRQDRQSPSRKVGGCCQQVRNDSAPD